jgi:hypothetical protein
LKEQVVSTVSQPPGDTRDIVMLFGQFVLHRSIGGDIFRADIRKILPP